jgi:hypothetical protein
MAETTEMKNPAYAKKYPCIAMECAKHLFYVLHFFPFHGQGRVF